MKVATDNSTLDPAVDSSDSIQDHWTFALAIHRLGEHDELVPWLYRVVETIREHLHLGPEAEAIQRFVGNLLKATMTKLAPDDADLLEAIEIGGETIGETAGKLVLSEKDTFRLLQRARTRFSAVLGGISISLSPASHG